MIVGAATAGIAGGIGLLVLPFTGEMEFDFPCCEGAKPPTTTEGVEELGTTGGDGDTDFFVALAYVRAGTAASGDVFPETDG